MRSMLLLLGLVLVPVAVAQDAPQPGPVDYGPLRTKSGMVTVSRVEPRFSRAAQTVAGGRRVEVRCWSRGDWARLQREWWTMLDYDLIAPAYSNPNDPAPRRRVHMSPDVCYQLAKLTYRRAWRTTSRKLDFAYAVVLLSHEAQHIRDNEFTEQQAECYGMQRARTVARSLGLTLREANQLVDVYWRFGYKRNQFRTSQCRNGGPLDLSVTRYFP